MSINIKDINVCHVMLGVVIGAGGVVAGMQLISLASKRTLENKRKEIQKKTLHRIAHSGGALSLPTLIRSPGPPSSSVVDGRDIETLATNLDALAMEAFMSEVNDQQQHERYQGGRSSPDNSTSAIAASASKPEDVQRLLTLLYKIGEAQTRRENTLHRGISCNICCANPLNGVRFKCLNCVDYDVCSRCEPSCDHYITHVFVKIVIPIPPLANPRTTLLQVFYPGKKTITEPLKWEDVLTLRDKTHFDPTHIEVLYDQYKSLCTHKNGITKDTFLLCLGPLSTKKNLVVDQLFRFYDADGDGFINFDDFVRGMSVLAKGTKTERMKYIFKGYDLDHDGYISKEDLQQMLKAYHQLSMELVRDVVRSCEEEMMANYDDVGNRPISAVFNAPIPESMNSHHSNTSLASASGGGRNNNSKNASSSSLIDSIGAGASTVSKELTPSVLQSTSSLNSIHRKSTHYERFSAVEAMTQDAIVELVDQIMVNADLDKDGQLSESEFYQYATTDTSLLCWFEAIDTVF